MNNVELMIFTVLAVGFPVFFACRVSEYPILVCVITAIPVILIIDLSLIFVFYGRSAMKYIFDTNTVVDTWSRLIDATLCIEGWRHFPPR